MSTNWKSGDFKVKPLLLFSCLDWGLGHTTRSVPLIKEFLILGCDVIVACNSIQKAVLQPEFPTLKFVELEGYNIIYGETGAGTRFKILLQFRKILTKIKSENRWLNTFLTKNHIDGLISDNRYGLYHPSVPSIFITHQLQVRSGYGWLADSLSRKILHKFINRFSFCWVPDYQNGKNLAGLLSHPIVRPAIPVRYLGPLSRLVICESSTEKKFDVLIIISGPEPQRSVFEKMMLEEAASVNTKKIAMVRGLPSSTVNLKATNITAFNHLDTFQLNELICQSELIICRSGYTTIMDMMKLKKRMIVIPTPGQPEQEYLAKHLSQNRYAISFSQGEFDLQYAIQKATSFAFNHLDTGMDEYKAVLKNFVELVSS